MSTQDILRELPRMSAEDRKLVAETLAGLAKEEGASEPQAAWQPRRAGLHEGNVLHVADDFDAPLPDRFWLGKDA